MNIEQMLEEASKLKETPEWIIKALQQIQKPPEKVALEYMVERCNQIADAAAPFLSFEMFKSTMNFSGDTPVRISVECQNGYAKTITLTDWRKLFIFAGMRAEQSNATDTKPPA